MSDQELMNKVVWVVGASGALGGEIAKAFLARGAVTVLSGRNKERLEACAHTFPSEKAIITPINVHSADEVDRAAANIVARHRRIDILVNSTSTSSFGDFLELTDEQWRQIFESKLFAYTRTMRAALPFMVEQGAGSIVNISGSGGKYPKFPSHIAGCSGNAAVNLASKAVADQFYSKGIRVNCVAPGPIRSPRFESLQEGDQKITGAEKSESNLGTAADIADATLFLASDRSRHINGIVLTVDGGSTPTI